MADLITQTISNIPLLRKRYTVSTLADQDDFVNKYEITNDHLSDVTVAELNSLSGQMNTAKDAIVVIQSDVNNKATSAAESALAASTSKTSAAESALASQNSYILCQTQANNSYTQIYNLVTNLVIPTAATYTYLESDNKFDSKFESFINFKI